ncbi:substrate-binding periplasmic protein [Pseudodesulfovibrio indicus]|uniref:ABC transporter substrate-binding protein n=1 Tax=Pseudodesulfovibrio indicus TaxID=1716143 RepID=A0A126QMH4_9BACT|nr:transporter substrate-binding domain-containing protein [Pseudodesulfovibrio indicus]AMK11094.1 ABC transporter substrate-binding protein [Pseudodesulfovibrio indicus]TDT92108.1 amino acid ABC transporter substrate-binding protein (PAAT family) [Pseudodesulfovibrio indicus]
MSWKVVLKPGIRGRLLASLCLALVLMLGLPLAADAGSGLPLRVAYPDYWPFFSRNEDGIMQGFFYDIVSEALNRMGIGSEWRDYPWSRCQALVQSGEADAMVTVPTAERLVYTATHADPFYLKKLKVFTYAGNPRLDEIRRIKSIDDIFDLGLTVVTYHGNGWNDKYIRSRGIKTYESPRIKNIWLMLANQRGDIAIEWPMAAWPLIDEGGVSKAIVETDVSLEAMPFHLLVSRRSPYAARMDEFNEFIKKMQAEGRIDRIISKYVVKQ